MSNWYDDIPLADSKEDKAWYDDIPLAEEDTPTSESKTIAESMGKTGEAIGDTLLSQKEKFQTYAKEESPFGAKTPDEIGVPTEEVPAVLHAGAAAATSIGRSFKDFASFARQYMEKSISESPDRAAAFGTTQEDAALAAKTTAQERTQQQEQSDQLPGNTVTEPLGNPFNLAIQSPVGRGATLLGAVGKTAINTVSGGLGGYSAGITPEEQAQQGKVGAIVGGVAPLALDAMGAPIKTSKGIVDTILHPIDSIKAALRTNPVVKKEFDKAVPVFDKQFMEEEQQASLMNVALSARNPTTLTEEQIAKTKAGLPEIPANTPATDVHKTIDAEIAALQAEKDATKVIEGKQPSDLVDAIHADIDKEIAVLKAERQATTFTDTTSKELSVDQFDNIAQSVDLATTKGNTYQDIKDTLVQNLTDAKRPPEEIDDIVEAALAPYKETNPITAPEVPPVKLTDDIDIVVSSPGDKLVTSKQMEKILGKWNITFAGARQKASTKSVNDLSVFNFVSRTFSSNNKKGILGKSRYGSGDTNLGDNVLNAIKNSRENQGQIAPSLVGAEDGSSEAILSTTKNGILRKDHDVKPLITVFKNGEKNGLTVEQMNEVRLAANALDDYNNIANELAAKNREIVLLKAKGASAEKLKAARKELKEIANKKTYQEYKDADGKSIPLPKQKVNQIISDIKTKPGGQEFLDDMSKLSKHLLDMRVDAGLITRKEADAMFAAHPYYLPAKREVEDWGFDNLTGSTKGVDRGNLKTREISSLPYSVDPIEATVSNMISSTRVAQRNFERQQMVYHFVKHLDDDAFQLVFRETKSDVIRAIKEAQTGVKTPVKAGAKPRTTPNVTKATDITKSDPASLENTGNFAVYFNGKRVDLTVKDKTVYGAITRPTAYKPYWENAYAEKGYKALLNVAQTQRNLTTTWNVMFGVKSIVKESLGYKYAADQKMVGRANLYKFWKSFSAVRELRKDKELRDYIYANVSPGATHRDYQNVGGLELAKKTSKTLNDGKSMGAVLASPAKKVVRSLEDFAQYSDIAARYRYYKDIKATTLKQGKSAEEAESAALAGARTLGTNYQERGAAKAFTGLQAVTPYMKTTVNSLVKDLSMGVYRKQQLAEVLAVSAGLYASVEQYNKQFLGEDGKPVIYKRPPSKGNFEIQYGNGINDYFIIPGPFSLWGKVETNLGQRLDNAAIAIAQKTIEKQKKTGEELIKEDSTFAKDSNRDTDQLNRFLLDSFIGQASPVAFLPVGMSTIAQVGFNQDWQGKPIQPTFLDKVENQDKYLPGQTSKSSIELAKLGIKGFDNPILNDYYVTSMTGQFGRMFLSGADMMIAAHKGEELPTGELRNLPGVSTFSGKGSEVTTQGTESQYSKLKQIVSRINSTYTLKKGRAKEGLIPTSEYNDYLEENHKLIELYKTAIEPADKHIAKLFKDITKLQGGKNIDSFSSTPQREFTGDPKIREKIDTIREEINDTRRGILKYIENNKEDYGDLWKKRVQVTPQTEGIFNIFEDLSPEDQKAIDKPKEKVYNKSEVYDDSNPPTMAEQSGMNLDTVNYIQDTTPSVYELFQPGGAKDFDPNDISISTGPEEPINKNAFFQRNFPNMTAKFGDKIKDFIINRTLKLEGGAAYTEHVENGKVTPTKFGVTLDTLKTTNPKATKEDVKALTEQKAADIYNKIYWVDAKVDALPKALKDVVFDGNINHGVPGMTKIIQRALNDLGVKTEVDGHMGQKTLQALNELPTEKLRIAILNRRQRLYDQHPDQEKFGAGWKKRLQTMIQTPNEIMEA